MTTDRSPEPHAAAREYFDETADTYAAHADARTSDLTSLIFASRTQTVLELLSQALGLGGSGRRSNGLAALAGTWSAEYVAELESALRFTEDVDDEVWR